MLASANAARLGTRVVRPTAHAKSHGVVAPRVGAGASAPPDPRDFRPGIKPLATIEREAPPREVWDGTQTRRGRDNEAAKDALAATMSHHGRTAAQRAATLAARERAAAVERARINALEKERTRRMSPEEMCDAIHDEIDERWAFLAQMERAGRGDAHRAKITAEISHRVRQLERLDEMLTARDEERYTRDVGTETVAERSRFAGAGAVVRTGDAYAEARRRAADGGAAFGFGSNVSSVVDERHRRRTSNR